MCIGGGMLNLLVFVAGPYLLGYPDLRQTAPAVGLLVVSVLFAAPMAALMRLRHHMDWRPTLEMSGATVALAVVLVGLATTGTISDASLTDWSLAFCLPACVVMVPVMLLRRDLYTGRS
jgi:hypothetical protein